MLARAMMTYANAAMMEHRGPAEGRLREYQAKFLEFSPAAADHFSGYVWCDLAIQIENAESFSVELSPGSERSWWTEGYINVHLKMEDGATRRYRSRDFRHSRGTDQVEATYQAILELAPIGLVGTFDAGEPPSFMRAKP